MKNISKDSILKALSHVKDPDLKRDLVSLKMIDEVQIGEGKVKFRLILTTPACPLKDHLTQACIKAIHDNMDKDLKVEVDLSSRVTTQRKANEELLKDVKNIIAIAPAKAEWVNPLLRLTSQ